MSDQEKEQTQELTERERQILNAVVHTYITAAEPVGSRSVVKRFHLDLSPATVRNTMADLEEMGLLKQVHTSSGRVPTDRGFRYYVKYLMKVQELTVVERERIEREYAQRMNDADEVLRQTSQLLALTTHVAGIVQAPSESRALVQRLDLMPLTAHRIAVLVADNYGRVRSMTVDLDAPISEVELAPLNRFLNDHLIGVEVDSMANAMEATLRRVFDEQRVMAERALQVLNLVPRNRPTRLFLEGATQLFELPEFTDVGRAREVFGLLAEHDRVADLLRQAVKRSENRGCAVVIGDEGTDLEGLSLVASPYEVEGERVGTLGIIGPRRMEYSRLTSVVDYTASLVGRLLTRLSR
jgi:heat-inducible transcriptional repressor